MIKIEEQIAAAEADVIEVSKAVDAARGEVFQIENDLKRARKRAGNALANWLSDTPRMTREQMTQEYLRDQQAERAARVAANGPPPPVDMLPRLKRSGFGNPVANRRMADSGEVVWKDGKIVRVQR